MITLNTVPFVSGTEIEKLVNILKENGYLTSLPANDEGDLVNGIILDEEPDYSVNMVYVSYEDELGVLTFSYYDGEGNQKGTAIDNSGDALDRDGYSVFAELRVPNSKFALIGRYDIFDFDDHDKIGDEENERYIAGLVYKYLENQKILLDFERTDFDGSNRDENRIQLTLQISF